MDANQKTLLAIAHIRAAREAIADYLEPERAQNPERLVDELIGILDAPELVEALGLEPLFRVNGRQ